MMDKERVKQELQKRYSYQCSGDQALMVDIMLDAIELSRQDDGVITGALVVCPECEGRGQVSSKDSTIGWRLCGRCNGDGSVRYY